MDAFADPHAAPVLGFDLGDSRSAVLARALDLRRCMVGAVMIVMDTRSIARGPTKLMTPKLQRALLEFAATQPTRKPTVPAPPPPNPVPARFAQEAAALPARSDASPPATQSPEPPTLQPLTPSAGLQRLKTAVPPELERLHAALRRTPISLQAQRLVPLSKGSALQRYEVLLRFKSDIGLNVAPQAMLKAAVENGLGSMIDRRVLNELIGFLSRHPHWGQSKAAMFSVNLTRTALHDEHFIKFVELCLVKADLPMGTIAFEIDTVTALALAHKLTGVAAALHRLGCPLVLDDFALRTQCFALLRLPGVRYVKLAPQITNKMRTDKVSQAAITAIVQMARVLGMHTVAKRTETPAEHDWLTALGVDFVQSNSMSPPVAIESLQFDAPS
jgi:EAL domain-containing protein (putative c-di-GMP-specific phosphodiesterase class I)